jgi:hypothetical protein
LSVSESELPPPSLHALVTSSSPRLATEKAVRAHFLRRAL